MLSGPVIRHKELIVADLRRSVAFPPQQAKYEISPLQLSAGERKNISHAIRDSIVGCDVQFNWFLSINYCIRSIIA